MGGVRADLIKREIREKRYSGSLCLQWTFNVLPRIVNIVGPYVFNGRLIFTSVLLRIVKV